MKRLLRRDLLLIPILAILLACGITPTETVEPVKNTNIPPIKQPTPLPPTPIVSSSTPPPSDAINPPVEDIPQPTNAPTLTPTPIAFGPIHAVLPASDITPGEFYDLKFLPDDGLWLLTDAGAARLKNNEWEHMLDYGDGIPAGMDDEGRIWILQPDLTAMHYWQDGSWYRDTNGWKPVSGYYSPQHQDLQIDQEGNLWYATPIDIRYFDGERWTVLPPEQIKMPAFDDDDIIRRFSIAYLQQYDEMWVGHCFWSGPGPFGGLGARWYDGERWRGSASVVSSGCVESFAVDEISHLVWTAVDEVVWSFDRIYGTWTSFAPPPAEPPYTRFGAVLELSLDPDGNPWAAFLACGGASCDTAHIYKLIDGQWLHIGGETLMWLDDQLIFDTQGTAWIFTTGSGILRVVDEHTEEIAPFSARGVTRDDVGNIWFVSNYLAGDLTLWVLSP